MNVNPMTMGTLGAALVVLVLSAASAGQDAPAGPGGFRGGFMGMVLNRANGQGGIRSGTNYGLLDNPAVQEELMLTADQKARIKQLAARLDRRRRELFAELNHRLSRNRNTLGVAGQPGQSGQEDAAAQPAAGSAMREIVETTQAEADALFATILKKSQRERLDQIELRRQGQLAVLRPDIAEKLNIGPDQQEQLEMVISEAREEVLQFVQDRRQAILRNATPDGRLDGKAMRARAESPAGKAELAQMRQRGAQIQDRTIREIGKVLTRRQKERFNALLGKPFDLVKLDGSSRPGGPGAAPGAGGQTDSSRPQTDRAGLKSNGP
jgi:Spy/CpxP family protein refolding chaperone